MQRNNNKNFLKRMLAFVSSVFMLTAVFAKTPLWTFEPLTATTVAVPANGTATVQYRVTNQSSKPHSLSVLPIQGIMQITTGLNVCGNPFVLRSKNSCVLSLQINGSQLSGPVTDGPVACQQGNLNQCYRPAQAQVLNITKEPVSQVPITATPTSLTLFAGQPGQSITVTNNSNTVTATNIQAILPASWTDVIQNAGACVTLAPGASCQIDLTASAGVHALAVVPIQGDNTNTAMVNLQVQFLPVAMAAGRYSDGSVIRPLLAVSQDSGVTWTYPSSINAPVFVPDNSNAFGYNGNFDGASCTGSTCVAAGLYYGSGATRPLLALSQDSGVTWTYPSSINAPVFVPDNSNAFNSSGFFNGASCTGSTCVATGQYYDGSVFRPLLAVSQDSGVTWTYPSSINAPVFVPDNSNAFSSSGVFNSASCSGSTCLAAGQYSDGGATRPLLAVSQDSGATWTYPSSINAPVFVPDNSNAFSNNGVYNGASCAGSTCVVAGRYSDGGATRPLLAVSQDSGATWTYPSSINAPVFVPDNSNAFSNNGIFSGASCTGSTCVAAGRYSGGSALRPLLAVSQDFGATWTYPSSINAPVFVPDNSNAFNSSGYFNGTSCAGSTCVAAGQYSDGSVIRPLLAVSQDSGATWTYPSSINAPVFVPDNSNAFSTSGSFNAASCTGSTCVVAGRYSDGSEIRPLLAVSQDSGATWTYPSSINAPAFVPDNSNAFNSNGIFFGTANFSSWVPNSLQFLIDARAP